MRLKRISNIYLWGVNPLKMLFKDPGMWFEFYIVSGVEFISQRFLKHKLRLKKYGGKRLVSTKQANKELYEKIQMMEPYMAGRMGSAELEYVKESILYENNYISEIRENRLNRTCVNCGFFPAEKNAFIRFSELMKESMELVDFLGVSYITMEGYFCKKYVRDSALLTQRFLFDFWRFEHPFTEALKGKKVLVIHPFEQTIIRQYKNRDKLFSNKNILPQFELQTLKAVQTAAGATDARFKTWFDALDYMTEEALKKDFDVALIGCGAYGFPLAARLKSAGKVAIHLGGVTQILFGIKGKRWDSHPTASKLYNEYWVRPSETDTPCNTSAVENSCYW